MPFSTRQSTPVSVLLAALKERDWHTFEHSNRTCGLACELGRRCGLGSSELEVLAMAASVHDVGKIGIPDSILLKPGRLDQQEWEIIKTHPLRGSAILQSAGLKKLEPVAAVILGHHENYGGNGYPAGTSGEAIPALSRIIALADCYDAMAETRPYHAPRSHAAIMRVMQLDEGNKFDPYLLGLFATLIERSPHRSTASD